MGKKFNVWDRSLFLYSRKVQKNFQHNKPVAGSIMLFEQRGEKFSCAREMAEIIANVLKLLLDSALQNF